MAQHCEFFPTHSEIDLTRFDQQMPAVLRKSPCLSIVKARLMLPVIFSFDSMGGIIGQINPTLAALRELTSSAKLASGLKPTVMIAHFCYSACLPILAALNEMAANDEIDLVVQPQTQLGFHGASSPIDESYSPDGTNRYLEYLMNNGVNSRWLQTNSRLFATTELTYFTPRDPQLLGSQLVDHAIVIDEHMWRSSRFRAWFNKRPVEEAAKEQVSI